MDVVKKTKVSDDPRIEDKILAPRLSKVIEATLDSLGIVCRVVKINNRPNDTEFCLELALGIPVENLIKLNRDIAMSIASPSGNVEIIAPIPGSSLVGIRVPYEKDTWQRAIENVDVTRDINLDPIKLPALKIEWRGARGLVAAPVYYLGRVMNIVGNICCELAKILNQR